jgi:hypothetical protein
MKKAAAALILLIPVFPVFAQGEETFDDPFEVKILEEEGEATAEEGNEEGLFESDLFEEPAKPETAEEIPPEEAFLVSEQLEWGGSFDLNLTTQVAWSDYIAPWESQFWTGGIPSLTTELRADLFFDARPDRDFRVFGKIKAAYTYPVDPLSANPGPGKWEVEIFELFSDFQIEDLLFFRAGKQTVQWGVGYFFSPADVLNLVSIDPEDPEAEREGPIALKTHFPFAAHNLYLYLVANDIDKPYEIAVAPKLELLLGNYELGIGGFYQVDLAPKGMLTLTGPLWDLDLSAEAMIQWGSDRTFYPAAGEAPANLDGLMFSGTAGLSYINSNWNLSLFAQYFFNGQGYLNYNYGILAGAAATLADTLYPGRQYLAASVGWSELLDSDFGLSLLYVANLSDGSGLVNPNVTWDPIDRVSLSTGLRISYSNDPGGDEYAPAGGTVAWTLGASLGAGRF